MSDPSAGCCDVKALPNERGAHSSKQESSSPSWGVCGWNVKFQRRGVVVHDLTHPGVIWSRSSGTNSCLIIQKAKNCPDHQFLFFFFLTAYALQMKLSQTDVI